MDNIGRFIIGVIFVSLGASTLMHVSDFVTQLDYSVIIVFLACFAVKRKNTQQDKEEDD